MMMVKKLSSMVKGFQEGKKLAEDGKELMHESEKLT